MEVIRGLHRIGQAHQRCAAALGFFDGVHKAHKALIGAAKAKAGSLGAKTLVYTFDRHPLEIVDPPRAPFLLTTNEEKISLMEKLGIDYLLVGEFNASISELSPQDFLKEIVVGALAARAVVVGYNYRYGKGHQGDVYTLLEEAQDLGFPVEVVEPVYVRNQPVSSTRIRRLLSDGKVEDAADLLERRYSLGGKVVKGDGRGKKLGFPTANLLVSERKLLPKIGIYAGIAMLGEREIGSLISIGVRPTFGGTDVVVEVYLLDFNEDIYGQDLSVEFAARIRDEENFDSPEALVSKIKSDVEEGRRILSRLIGADVIGAEEGKTAAKRKFSR